jgi:hypothetical protein
MAQEIMRMAQKAVDAVVAFECEHIYGYQDIDYDGVLIDSKESLERLREYSNDVFIFNYCPRCGKKL